MNEMQTFKFGECQRFLLLKLNKQINLLDFFKTIIMVKVDLEIDSLQTLSKLWCALVSVQIYFVGAWRYSQRTHRYS